MAPGDAGWQGWPGVRGRAAEGAGPAGLVRAISGHPLLIALVAAGAVLAALLWTATRSESYQATAEILVTPAPDDGGPDRSLPLLRASGDTTRIIQTAASLVDSAGAAERTADALGAGWTPERVDGAVTVEPVGQTDVLAVTAEAESPQLAARVANTFVDGALDTRAELLRPRFDALQAQLQEEVQSEGDASSSAASDARERLSELRAMAAAGDPTLSLTRSAAVADAPAGTPGWVLVAAALLAGLAVGVGAALALDLIGPARVADAADAWEITGAPILARVPAPSPDGSSRPPPPAVAAALRAAEVRLRADESHGRVVLVAGTSVGDGASDCATDLGAVVAQGGRNVVVADLDAPDAVAMLPALTKRHDCVLASVDSLAESVAASHALDAFDTIILVVRTQHTTVDDLDAAMAVLLAAYRPPDGIIVITGWEREPRPPVTEPIVQARRGPRARRQRQA